MPRQVSERRASIDVGTNSVRLPVADVAPDGRICALIRRGMVTRLGEGLDASGMIREEAAERTLRAILSVVEEARSAGAARILLAATSALRSARNGPDLAMRIERETGVRVHIISGQEEARIVFSAVQSGISEEHRTIVMDIGGGSTEFGFGYGPRLKGSLSLDLGCVRLYERAVLHGGVESEAGYQHLRETLHEALSAAAANHLEEFRGAAIRGVGGTLTAFAMVHLGTRQYDPDALDGTEMSRERLLEVSQALRSMTQPERRRWVGEGRSELVLAGAAILDESAEYFSARCVQVSSRGLRFGLLVDNLDNIA